MFIPYLFVYTLQTGKTAIDHDNIVKNDPQTDISFLGG